MRALTILFAAAGLAACEPTRTSPAQSAAEEQVHQGVDLLIPAEGFLSPRPTLKWGRHDDASLYELEIDDSEQCSSPLQVFRVKQPQRTLDHLATGTYFACLRAVNAHGKELARSYGEFTVKADDAADPKSQNAVGGSGSPVSTAGLSPFPLYLGDEMGTPTAFGAFADPADDDRLKFLVNDRTHRRVLVYDKVPTSSEDRPSLKIEGYGDNVHVSVCPNGKVLVTDRGKHRVLVYDKIPRRSGARPDLVIGQPDFVTHIAGVGAGSLKQPGAAYCMDDHLVVLDRGNHRILVWQAFPVKSGARADWVIGQPDATATEPACGRASLNSPSAALFADGRFFVVDSGNNRVLGFPGFPEAGAEPDLVIGQRTLASCKRNAGGKVSARGLDAPSALALRDGVLAVGDPGNHRVLFFFGPLKNGQPAGRVLGQDDFEKNVATAKGQLNDAASAKGLLFDGGFLWVAASRGCRSCS